MAEAGASRSSSSPVASRPPGMYPGVDSRPDARRDAPRARAADRRRPLRERPNRRLRDRAAQAEGRDGRRSLGRGAALVQRAAAAQRVSPSPQRRRAADGDRARDGSHRRSMPCERRAGAGRRRVGRDVPPLPVPTREAMAGDLRLKWNPPSRNRRFGRPALGARCARGTSTRSARDHAPLPKDGRRGRVDEPPGAGNGPSRCCRVVATEALHARGIVGSAGSSTCLSTTPARALRPLPRARGRSASAPTPTSPSWRRTAAGCSTPRTWSTTSSRSGPPSTDARCASIPSTPSCAAGSIFAEGEVVGEPGFGELLAGRRPCPPDATHAEGVRTAPHLHGSRARAAAARRRGSRSAIPTRSRLPRTSCWSGARAGAGYDDARASVHELFSRDQLVPGVAELLEAPAQIEASFGDGTRLVPLERLVRP